MQTLSELLAHLSNLDNAAEPIDPEIFKNLRDEIAGKIDAIKTVLDRLQAEAARLEKAAAEFKMAAATVTANLDRLKSYTLWAMQQADVEKLPGEYWSISRRTSPVSVEVDREATDIEATLYPNLIKTKVSHSWNREELKRLLQTGAEEINFARLKQGQYVQFVVRKSQ